jgi:four helix bundle protein
MKDFRELQVWLKAHQMVLAAYEITRPFPSDEKFGLTAQIRRASVSVAANIAEGCGRWGDGEFARFLQMAMGSLMEVDYECLLARDLGYLPVPKYKSMLSQINEVRRMLASLLRKVEADRHPA